MLAIHGSLGFAEPRAEAVRALPDRRAEGEMQEQQIRPAASLLRIALLGVLRAGLGANPRPGVREMVRTRQPKEYFGCGKA